MIVTTSIGVADSNEHTIEIYTGEDEQEEGNMPMYEKQTWVTGETITEDKLNHMEDGIATGGGIYTYEEVTAFDGEVTTVDDGGRYSGDFLLQGELPKSDINVTFNDQNYTLPYGYAERPGDYWGEVSDGPSFINYPLLILNGGVLYTAEAGTHSLKINETVEKIEINDAFQNDFYVSVNIALDGLILDKTYSEIYEAYSKHKNVKFLGGGPSYYTEYHMALVTPSEIVLFTIDNNNTIQTSDFKYTTLGGYPSTSGGGLM